MIPWRSRGNERIDIRVGVERRRRWGREGKLRILGESLAPNAVVTDVARRHEISTSLLYTWRRQALTGLLRGLRVAADAGSAMLPALDAHDKVVAEENRSQAARSPGLIEVVWPNGIVVRVDAGVDDRALRSVLTALEAR